MAERLLEVKDLHTSFFTDAGEVKAVNGLSFNLDEGKSWESSVNPVPEKAFRLIPSCVF